MSRHANRSSAVRPDGTVDPHALDRLVQQVVQIAAPKRIILFGSAARGDMRVHSDIDLLVVKDNVHRRQLAGDIHEHLRGIGAAVDIVVATPEDIERYADCHALVIKQALQEGKIVYEAA